MILSVILAVGAVPVPVKASVVKVENYADLPAPELNIQLDNLLAGNQPRVIEIVVTESEYNKKVAEEAKKKKEAQRANLTNNLALSGTRYGNHRLVYQDNTDNCVGWWKSQTGIYRTVGNGGRAGINSEIPSVGAGAVLKGRPHMGLIKEVRANGVILWESNYIKGWIVEREIPYSMIMGYIVR